MKYLLNSILFVALLTFSSYAGAWGMLGHRVIGEVASHHINSKTEKQIKKVLGCQTLAEVSNFMDDIKSDNIERYDTLNAYHYVSIPDGLTYGESNINAKGDAIVGMNTAIRLLKSANLSLEDQQFYLKMLVHLVGDLHQPLHVGRVDDRGGNNIRVSWFGTNSNLHRVWDSDIINGKLYSYTELTKIINHTTPEQVSEWQNATIDDWVKECQDLRPSIYDFEEGRSWEYKYMYVHWPIMKQQLLKGGVRLAGILNDIYG